MIRLITDTSCLYTPSEAKEMGFTSIPLSVTIAGKSYLEFVDIQSEQFLELINQGHVPSSSQPSVGSVLEAIESVDMNDEIVYLCIADGLSGAYQTALLAVNQLPEERQKTIHVVNSKSLCGPHRHLVQKILEWIKNGDSIEVLLDKLNKKIETSSSFLAPADFGFLKRGGRCTPLAATIGGLLKLQPVVMQTKDGKRLDKFTTGRSFDIAMNKVINTLMERGLDGKKVFIVHAFAEERAQKVKKKIMDLMPKLTIELLNLSCAFITQGGPYCLAIQTIEE